MKVTKQTLAMTRGVHILAKGGVVLGRADDVLLVVMLPDGVYAAGNVKDWPPRRKAQLIAVLASTIFSATNQLLSATPGERRNGGSK